LEAPSPITAARALPEAFTALTIEAARHLVRAGVRLVGIDTPSIDDPQAADLPVHRVLAREGVAILEWLDLEQVQEGIYQLVALPLRLDPSEASPVRAILIERS
jgi:arylformamidase